MKLRLSAMAPLLFACALAGPTASRAGDFWLVETRDGQVPTVQFIRKYNTGSGCLLAAIARKPEGFATCLAISEAAEYALSDAIFNFGDPAPCAPGNLDPRAETVAECEARQK